MRARRYELLVHLTEHPRGAWLSRLLGARYSVAPGMLDRGGWWRKSFTHLYPRVPNRHEVEVNLDALRRIGVYPGLNERKIHFVPGADAPFVLGNTPVLVGLVRKAWSEVASLDGLTAVLPLAMPSRRHLAKS